MPTYNRENLISRAINSVLNQTLSNWELLVVDDGSTDSTKYIVSKFISKETRIKYYLKEHNGLSNTLNFGLKHSTGDYVTFLDSDDEYMSDHLSLRYEFMNQNRQIDLIHGGVEVITSKNNYFVKDKNDLTKLIHLKDCIIGATFFGKKKVFEEMGGFKDIYSQDSDFYERASKVFNITKVNFPTYKYYRDTEDSICNMI